MGGQKLGGENEAVLFHWALIQNCSSPELQGCEEGPSLASFATSRVGW